MSASDSDLAARSMSFERLLDAPRELVWKIWTDPRHVVNWWGPNGFRNTNLEMDVRPGGSWRFIMHGPDGTDYPNRITFIEVRPPERLVYAHAGEDATDDVRFHVTVTFAARGDKTQLTMRMEFPTAEEMRHVIEEFGAEEGAHQHMARMADYLATLPAEQAS